MACLFSVSQTQYSPGKWSFFCSEFNSTVSQMKSSGRGSMKLSSRIFIRKLRICSSSTKDTQSESNGEDPPESLFIKELKKRGMTPTSLLEESKKSTSAGEETSFREEDGGSSQRNAVSTNAGRNLTNQMEQSRALNSEGIEGLIPRAKLLLTLGATFFLGFWPLILITVAFFSTLYLYFGPNFVHDAKNTGISPPENIDPSQLLEEERIAETAPRLN